MRSLQPLILAPNVRADVIVRLIVGDMDDMGLMQDSLRYAQALQERGVDVRIAVLPSLGHNILLTKPVLATAAELLRAE